MLGLSYMAAKKPHIMKNLTLVLPNPGFSMFLFKVNLK